MPGVMLGGAAASVVMAEAVILVKQVHEAVARMRHNKKFGLWLDSHAQAFEAVLSRSDIEATDEWKQGVDHLRAALTQGLELCKKLNQRGRMSALFKSGSDSAKLDDIQRKLILAGQLLHVQLAIEDRELHTAHYEDIMEMLGEVAEENWGFNEQTRERISDGLKVIQDDFRKVRSEQGDHKQRLSHLELLLSQLIEVLRSDPRAMEKVKLEQDLVHVTNSLSNVVLARNECPVSDSFYEKAVSPGSMTDATVSSMDWQELQREEVKNRFLHSMGSLMKANTPVVILGVHGIPDMFLEEGIYSAREIMASFRFAFVRGLAQLRNRIKTSPGSFPAEDLDKVLENIIRLDRRERLPQRGWFDNFNEKATSIRGSIEGAPLDPQPTGLVGLVNVSTTGEVYARCDSGNPIWCRIGEWQWHRCVGPISDGVRALIPVNCGNVPPQWFSGFCVYFRSKKPCLRSLLTNITVMLPWKLSQSVRSRFRGKVRPNRTTLAAARQAVNPRPPESIEAGCETASDISSLWQWTEDAILSLTLQEQEEFLSLEQLRQRPGFNEVTDRDLTAAFSVHATEILSLDKVVEAWEDKKNLPLKSSEEGAEFGIAAAFLRSQVTRQSASEELGTSNSRFGFTMLRSKMGSTLSWPGSNALIVSSDGMEDNLGNAVDHGLKERSEPFPLLSFSALCIAGGVDKDEQKLKKAAALISATPKSLIQPRYLCREVLDESTTIRIYDLIQSLECTSASEEEASVRDASVRYAIFELFTGGATLANDASPIKSFAEAVLDTVTPEFTSGVKVDTDCQIRLNGLFIRNYQHIEYLWALNNKAVTFQVRDGGWLLSAQDIKILGDIQEGDRIDGDIRAA